MPLPGFPRTREWLTKAEITMTGVEENWLAGRLAEALNLGREEAGKERKAGAGTTEDGEKIAPSTQGSNGRTEAVRLWT